MKILLTIALLLIPFCSRAQVPPAYKDSLLWEILKEIPAEEHAKFTEEYNMMSAEQIKEFADFIFYMESLPMSSKKELIENIKTNYSSIDQLQTFYTKLIPKEYSVHIEFAPPEKILNIGENINISASKKKGGHIFQEWHVELSSPKVDSLLKIIKLTRKDLTQLQDHLRKAHCISVSNGNPFGIGFARSGMGMYSFLVFDHKLSPKEIEMHNNGCEYIFYKENIVLQYGGGAIGPQCFPDKD